MTLGPSTRTEEDLRKIKESGVDFVRINMSHSSAEDLRYYIKLSKKVGIPFIIDTEGSQVRTGELKEARIYFEEGTRVMLTNKKIVGDKTKISIRPAEILSQLDVGDVIYCDLGSLILRVHDVQNASSGHISAQVI
ncbi:MAG: pyruvate kinase, partial [SAR202 cluster bacterium]|nr:pyruvate kinase [SAR202 cluster bacterium]